LVVRDASRGLDHDESDLSSEPRANQMAFDEFEGKMLGLVGVSGGRMGAFGAMNLLASSSNSRGL
jgi:hypothetical protein